MPVVTIYHICRFLLENATLTIFARHASKDSEQAFHCTDVDNRSIDTNGVPIIKYAVANYFSTREFTTLVNVIKSGAWQIRNSSNGNQSSYILLLQFYNFCPFYS